MHSAQLRTHLVWVSLLYFIQGLPFGLFEGALPVFFRTHGISLADIGALTLLQLPWSLKVFWSPLVDRLGSLKIWIASSLVVMAVIITQCKPIANVTLVVLLGMMALASATQDIAIDAAFVRLLAPHEHPVGNGVRVAAYRIAMIVGGGLTVVVAGMSGWQPVFVSVALVMVILAVIQLRLPLTPLQHKLSLAGAMVAVWRWVRRPAAVPLFLFILLYKLGDTAMAPMVRPFWVDRGVPPQIIGLATTIIGVVASTGGALIGGWYTSRWGIISGLAVLGLAQAGSNLGYALVAWLELGTWALWGASICESLSAGLGTAALLSLLTSSCEREHAAMQYALLSAIFALTRTVAGSFSGVGAEQLGYAGWFAITFVLSFPAYVLLPQVKRWFVAGGGSTTDRVKI